MQHAIAVGTLPVDHKDPFDRILAAQCLLENLALAPLAPPQRGLFFFSATRAAYG